VVLDVDLRASFGTVLLKTAFKSLQEKVSPWLIFMHQKLHTDTTPITYGRIKLGSVKCTVTIQKLDLSGFQMVINWTQFVSGFQIVKDHPISSPVLNDHFIMEKLFYKLSIRIQNGQAWYHSKSV
jgi:hypothetical protein